MRNPELWEFPDFSRIPLGLNVDFTGQDILQRYGSLDLK